MQVPMAKVHIVGHRRRLAAVLEVLHGWRGVHLIDVSADSTVTLPPLTVDDEQLHDLEELRYLRTRLDALLRLCPTPLPELPPEPVDTQVLRAELDDVGGHIEEMVAHLDDLRQEQETLPRHLESLRRLLPLVPDLSAIADLDRYDTAVLLIDVRHAAVLGELNAHLTEELGGNFEIISDRLDRQTLGAILIYPKHAADRVQGELGREQVSRLRLPARYDDLSFREALVAMERRLVELPAEIESAEDVLAEVVRAHPHWTAARAGIAARLDQLNAIRSLGATPHTFALSGWVPCDRLPEMRERLASTAGEEIVLEEVPPQPGENPPVLLRNRAVARPFESLVRLLDIPHYGSLDPSTLMLIFLPLFFGMMLGDVVYGLLTMAIAWWGRHRFRGMARDLSTVLILGGAWATVWGVIYGEYLGDLGYRLFGIEPLWINRAEAIGPLLLFSIAIGGAHMILALMIGIWQSARERRARQAGERIGLLVALAGLFAIAAVAADALPAAVRTPALAALVVGLVVLIWAGGPMGLLTGPLAMIGGVGNVLSYLRIAAIGMASVYLARIANELGYAAPVLLGVVVAALFHALNLALGMFSPTIQALRLHYVEFFDKFFEGGGVRYQPFGSSSPTKPDQPTELRR
jgi:V/A-type H+-transporting ATPase subunit I